MPLPFLAAADKGRINAYGDCHRLCCQFDHGAILMQNPIYSGRVFRREVGQAYRFDVGHRSEMKPATLAG